MAMWAAADVKGPISKHLEARIKVRIRIEDQRQIADGASCGITHQALKPSTMLGSMVRAHYGLRYAASMKDGDMMTITVKGRGRSTETRRSKRAGAASRRDGKHPHRLVPASGRRERRPACR